MVAWKILKQNLNTSKCAFFKSKQINGYRISVWEDNKVLEIVLVVAQQCEHAYH